MERDGHGMIVRAIGSLVVVLATVVLGPAAARALPGDELWADHQDGGGFGGRAYAALAVGRLFLVGGTIDVDGMGVATVRAYDAKSGVLAWEDQYLEAGMNDGVQKLAAKGRRVFGVGTTRDRSIVEGGTQDELVRSWNAKTGRVLWTSVAAVAGQQYAVDVAVKGKTVVVLSESELDFPDNDAVLTAFDARTGAVSWAVTYDTAAGISQDRPVALALLGKHVFIVGTTRIAFDPGGQLETFVRVHDLRTGALIWETQVADVEARDVVARGKSVVVGGNLPTATEGDNWWVAAFDRRDGTPQWSDELDGADRPDELHTLAVVGRRVLAGGSITVGASDWSAGIRAYDAKTGAEQWTAEFDGGGGFDEVVDLAVAGKTVLAALNVRNAVAGEQEIALLAVALRDGGVLWDSRAGLVVAEGDQAHAVAAKGKRAVVVGRRHLVPGDGAFYARGVSLK